MRHLFRVEDIDQNSQNVAKKYPECSKNVAKTLQNVANMSAKSSQNVDKKYPECSHNVAKR
jgi:hypothetical protein